VISNWLGGRDASVSDHAVRKVKKNRFDFYRRAFPKDSLQISCRNRFARRKNPIPGLKRNNLTSRDIALVRLASLSGVETGLIGRKIPPIRAILGCCRSGEMDEEMDASVTTNHLLLQRQRREVCVLLPISQPNPNSACGNYTEKVEGGAGGAPAGRSGRKGYIDDRTRNFIPNDPIN
jgi:hypothetical protein